jgi:hypothetical protein
MKRWAENLWILTIDEYDNLPNGTELTCIDGEIAVKGRDDIDLDTRFGYISYGIVDPFNHPLKEQLLFFRLAT